MCGIIKFTWAPRNVVLAQGGTAKFIQEGLINIYPTVNYLEERSFSKWKDMVDLGYSNRFKKYRSVYGLDDADLI
jgi:uncharacterized membrane protein YukC